MDAIIIFLGIKGFIPTISLLVHPLTMSTILLIILLLPFGMADFAETKKLQEAERRIPDFLRDLAGHTTFGTPVSEAILRSSGNDYGPLNEEVRHVASLISIGVPVENALDGFGTILGDQTIARVGKILKKASESGSNTADVISMISSFTTQTYLMRESRAADMQNYSMVMAVSYGVFLFVILMLDLDFFTQLKPSGISGSTLSPGVASFPVIERIFSLGIIVQSLTSGLISGVFRDGRLVSGAMIAGVLLLISFVVLTFAGVL
ncbi:MAG: type II secretion system F family protein [Candidatus Thermoplasmatota archaeon]|nr:type II secretion system F family protein [Candidatus Thermoplasmatota archaeon]